MLPQLALAAQPPTDAIWYRLFYYYEFFGFAAGAIVIGFMVWQVLINGRGGRSDVQEAPKFHPRESGWGDLKTILRLLAITGSVLAFVEYQTFASNSLYVPPQSADPLHIQVIAKQWEWIFVYPNGVRIEGNLTVPQNEEVILNITSIDVAHSFTIPNLSVAKDAIPGRYNTLWFNATSTGTDIIRCKELCGIGHALMLGYLTVVTQQGVPRTGNPPSPLATRT